MSLGTFQRAILLFFDNSYSFIDLFQFTLLSESLSTNDIIVYIGKSLESLTEKRLHNELCCRINHPSDSISVICYNDDRSCIETRNRLRAHLREKNISCITLIMGSTSGQMANMLLRVARMASHSLCIGYPVCIPTAASINYYHERTRDFPKGRLRDISYSPETLSAFGEMTQQEFDNDFEQAKLDAFVCLDESWYRLFNELYSSIPSFLQKQNCIASVDGSQPPLCSLSATSLIICLDIFQTEAGAKALSDAVHTVLGIHRDITRIVIRPHPRAPHYGKYFRIYLTNSLKSIPHHSGKIDLHIMYDGALVSCLSANSAVIAYPSAALFAIKHMKVDVFISDVHFQRHCSSIGLVGMPPLSPYVPASDSNLNIFRIDESGVVRPFCNTSASGVHKLITFRQLFSYFESKWMKHQDDIAVN
jgi:hypothetical protein